MSDSTCPDCGQECETYVDDQRFAAHSPGGVQTYGEIYLLSECCDAVIDDDPDYYDDYDDNYYYDNPEDDYIN